MEGELIGELIWLYNDALESARANWLQENLSGDANARLLVILTPASLGLPFFTDDLQAERARKQQLRISERLHGRNVVMDRVIFGMEKVETAGTFAGIGVGGNILFTAVKKGGKWAVVKVLAGAAVGMTAEQAVEQGLRAIGAGEQTIRGLRLAAVVITYILLRRRSRSADTRIHAALTKPATAPPAAPPDRTGRTVFDATRGYLQNARLAVGDYLTPGDSVIKSGAGTIGVQSLTLDNPRVGNTLGPNRDETYEQAKCVLNELGLPLPASQNGVYWANLGAANVGYTVDWSGFGFNRLSYSFISNRYRGVSIKSQLFEDLLITLYHEVKGHNVDGAQHRNRQEEAAFGAAYDVKVTAAIAAAKANGTWTKIINRNCVKP